MSKYSENIPPDILGAIGWFYDDIPEGSTVLDVGCSTGYYGAYIRKHKQCLVYGIEISNDRKEAGKVLDGVYSFDLDAEWPEEIYERKYDVVFLGDVIEHLKNPDASFRNILKLLSKNGRVFVSTPNVAHISVRLELLGGNFEYEKMGILDSTHLKYFTLNSLSDLVTGAGYNIVRIDSSESDYPKEVVESLLEQYGLSANKKFWNMVASPAARTFQYKLVLEPVGKAGRRLPNPAPAKKPEQYKADFIRNLQLENKDWRAEVEATRKVIEDIKKQNEKLNKALSEVVNSKAFKTAQRLQRAKLKAKKLTRG